MGLEWGWDVDKMGVGQVEQGLDGVGMGLGRGRDRVGTRFGHGWDGGGT